MADNEKRIILISDFIEQKLRKERELEFYEKELQELTVKINFLRREVHLTNTIINMIKSENVVDFKEQLLANENKEQQLPLPLKKDEDKKE